MTDCASGVIVRVVDVRAKEGTVFVWVVALYLTLFDDIHSLVRGRSQIMLLDDRLGDVRQHLGDDERLFIHHTDILQRVLILEQQSSCLLLGILLDVQQCPCQLDLSLAEANFADDVDASHLPDCLEELSHALALINGKVDEDGALSLRLLGDELFGFVHESNAGATMERGALILKHADVLERVHILLHRPVDVGSEDLG